jgi:phage gpG-like protein
MTGVMSILEFVAETKSIEHDLKKVEHAIVARACEMVCAEAKRVIGEGYPEWPALAPGTLAHKMMNTPLLETGELRGSIEWNAEGNEGFVGSNLEKAVWHELGTSKIPPRPFLMGAAMRMEPLIHAMAAKAVMAVLAGRGLHSSELGELIHLLKHVAHEVKETVTEMTKDDTEQRRR